MNSVCVSVIGDVAAPYKESIVSMRHFIARVSSTATPIGTAGVMVLRRRHSAIDNPQ
jgi:hypothetical protein